MADPWDNVPVVREREPVVRGAVQQRPDGTRYGVVNSAYTNETPEELAAQGYVLDPETGTYARTVGAAEDPTQGRPSPWDSVPVVTEGQTRADAQAAVAVPNTDAASREIQLYQGLLGSFADEAAGGIAGLGQATRNIARSATGQPIDVTAGDYRDAVTQRYRDQDQQFRQSNPIQSLALQGAGGVLSAGALAPAAAFGTGLRGAVASGAAGGAVYGAGSGQGGVVERLPGAAAGAAIGGAAGGAFQAAQPYAQRLGGIVAGAARRVVGRPVANAEQTAALRLADTFDPAAAEQEIARRQALGIGGTAADVMGGTSERLIRTAAGPAGPGAERAVANLTRQQANLRPELISVTRSLDPDPRTAAAVREGLEETRSTLATEQYRPAYATQVQVTDEVMSALGDEPGRAALRRARQAAVARRDADQVAEIDGLLNGTGNGTVSAGTLDRVRIAMGNRAESLARNATGARDVAGGLRGRAADLDMALSNVDELAPARATYRNLSGAIDAVDNAPNVFTTAPDDYARVVTAYTPEQRQAAIIGVRQEIMDTLGGQRNAGTGTLDRITQSDYGRQNLATLLGPDEAARYQDIIATRVGDVQRAGRISPNTNSQTFGRGIDEETFNAANMVGTAVDVLQGARGNPLAIARVFDKVRANATMTPQEREAIASLGLGPMEDVQRIIQLADQARAAGRPPPREVRAWVVNANSTLGAQHPVAIELQQLLLPSRVLANEQEGQPPQ